MAEGRFISRRVAYDKELNALSLPAHLLYLMTIPHLDRDGLILGDDSLLWGAVAPRRPELLPQVEAAVQEWVDARLVVAYESRIGRCLFFPGFRKNQQGLRYDREAASRLPVPPGYVRTPTGLQQVGQAAGLPPDLCRTSAGLPPEADGVCRPEVEVEEEEEGEGEAEGLPPELSRTAAGPSPDSRRTSAGTAPEVYDAAVADFVRVYEQNIGMIAPIQHGEMVAWVEEAVDRGLTPWLAQAVTEAVNHNARSWAYVQSILRRSFEQGRPPGQAQDTASRRNGRSNPGLAAVEARRAETPAQAGLGITDPAAGVASQFRRSNGNP